MPTNSEIRNCKIHGLTEYSVRESGGYIKKVCKKCRVAFVKAGNLKRKIKMVEYKGGKCCICGYNKNLAALDFHHKNPLTKDFELSYYSRKNWESIVLELEDRKSVV